MTYIDFSDLFSLRELRRSASSFKRATSRERQAKHAAKRQTAEARGSLVALRTGPSRHVVTRSKIGAGARLILTEAVDAVGLTALLMGDPAPSRSALNRRPVEHNVSVPVVRFLERAEGR